MSNIAKILVVDDESFNQEVLSEILTNEGYDVLCRDNGEAALQVISDYEPDLILLDIIMPGIDGFEVTRQLKANEKYQYIPIVLQTALDDRSSCIRGLKLGAADYITKPIDPLELSARISNLLHLKKLNDLLKYNNQILADYDSLTGLANRSLFMRSLESSLDESLINNTSTALILFTTYNHDDITKAHGSSLGDLALKGIAKRLQALATNITTLGYISSDLFAIVVNANKGQVKQIARTIQSSFEKPFILLNQEIFINCYMGIAQSPNDGTDVDTLFRRAKIVLDKVKLQGINQFMFFSSSMDEIAAQHYTLEQDLHKAVQQEEFCLNYQPKVDLLDGQVKSAESLIRWHHPSKGSISPAKFIPIAEQCGLIIPITRWVLNTACRQAKAWQTKCDVELKIAVNISSRHFRNGDLVADVSQALENSGLAAKYLELEITENVMVDDFDVVLDKLSQLQALGVKLSIDDFGTGYSSLSYLKRIPVNRVKIDQSFVRNITANSGNAVITRSIIAMSHQFGYQVIAEGVETQEELCFLIRHQCDTIQGYYFSKPLIAEQFEQLLISKRRLHMTKVFPYLEQKTLLIVDDDQAYLDALTRLVSNEGYIILLANNADEALNVLAQHEVDVLLTDQTPCQNNDETFLSKVQTIYPNTVRLLLTTKDNIDAAINWCNEGEVYKFYLKPWNASQLKRNIKEAFHFKAVVYAMSQQQINPTSCDMHCSIMVKN